MRLLVVVLLVEVLSTRRPDRVTDGLINHNLNVREIFVVVGVMGHVPVATPSRTRTTTSLPVRHGVTVTFRVVVLVGHGAIK